MTVPGGSHEPLAYGGLLQQSHRAELARDAEGGTVSVAKAWGGATATRSAPGGGRTTATVVAQTGGSAIPADPWRSESVTDVLRFQSSGTQSVGRASHGDRDRDEGRSVGAENAAGLVGLHDVPRR